MTHVELLASLTARVRDAGAAAALTELRGARPNLATPAGSIGYHDTLAVFYVWAVERLVMAGLTDVQILWHPLVDTRSPRAWWDDALLESEAARDEFVPSSRARPGDPAPSAERALVAA
jgi:hypothetical protein